MGFIREVYGIAFLKFGEKNMTKKRCNPVDQEGESMSFLLKKRAIMELIFILFHPVLKLSFSRPKVVLRLSFSCPDEKSEKCRSLVLKPSFSRPKAVLKLSAQNREKRTTPFGGMARPYYSLPTPLFHSFLSLFLIPYLLSLFPLKFSQEYKK